MEKESCTTVGQAMRGAQPRYAIQKEGQGGRGGN